MAMDNPVWICHHDPGINVDHLDHLTNRIVDYSRLYEWRCQLWCITALSGAGAHIAIAT